MKKIFFVLLIGVLVVPFLFTTTSCTPNNNPMPIHDTIYIRDTLHTHDTVECTNCFGAVGCYLFNGNANDTSGNGNHGTVIGATLTTGHKGNANSAYYFNQSADTRIELPNLGVFDNTGELSVSVWTNTSSTSSGGNTIINTTPDEVTGRFMLTINWTGNPVNTSIFDYGNISTGRLVSPAAAIVYNTWEHYVFVKSTVGNFMKIYRNGVEIATKTGGASISNKNKIVVLGGSPANSIHTNQLFKGSLDDLKIFNKALSATEVLTIYNTEK